MEPFKTEQVMGLLHAYLAALSAVLATHPNPAELRRAFDVFADQMEDRLEDPLTGATYAATMDTLRQVIEP